VNAAYASRVESGDTHLSRYFTSASLEIADLVLEEFPMFKQMIPAVFALVLVAGPASAKGPDPQETRQENIEFVAWSEDSSSYLVKVTNNSSPATIFQVRDTETGEILKKGKKVAVEIANGQEEEIKVQKKMIRAYGMSQEPITEAVHPRRDNIMVMTGQKKDKFVIMGLNDERATPYDKIDVMRDGKDNLAKTFQKQLVWDQNGRYLAIVYRTKLESDPIFEGDMMYVTRFKTSRVKSASGEGDDE